MTSGDQEALLAWAEDYWKRVTSSSFSGHLRIFQAFTGQKIRLQTRSEVVAFALQAMG